VGKDYVPPKFTVEILTPKTLEILGDRVFTELSMLKQNQ
jgi:hypothetical protein